MVPTVDSQVFTQILREFVDRYPKVQVSIQSLSTSAQIGGLRAGTLGAGVLRLPVRDDSLTVQVISREPLIAALPAGHPLARTARLSLTALADERLVIFPRHLAPGYYDTIVSLFQQAGLHLRIGHETEHGQIILGLVAGGLGSRSCPDR